MNVNDSGLYKLFVREDKAAWFSIILAASLAGLLQGCIVLIINQAAEGIINKGPDLRHLLLFLLTLSAYSYASHYSISRTIALTERIIFSTFVNIADKIRNASTLSFERIGKSSIYSTLYTNTDIILETSKSLASVGAAVMMIIFSAIYIAYISESAIITIIVFYSFGIFVYVSNFSRIQKLLKETTVRENKFKSLFKYFLEGFKEIKVNHAKGEDLFHNYIGKESARAQEARIKAESHLTGNNVFIQSFYYALVAAMIFLLPKLKPMDPVEMVKVVAVVLFSYGSMTRIVMAIPLILKAEKAVAKLDQLGADLDKVQETSRPYSGRLAKKATSELSLSLEEVVFEYPEADLDSGFTLGPLSLKVEPGEILFIIGGNGSGKTTLLKIIAGLYYPASGRILLGGQAVNETNYTDYRNLFSVIFPDYYLFDKFYGQKEIDRELLDETLSRMGLQERIQYEDERFTDLNLSAGQKKRLALVCSHLEARPLLVIDEVAADLDPQFRRYFYEDYLTELKASGVTIVAVSHDEKYFHVADRLVKLANGSIVSA